MTINEMKKIVVQFLSIAINLRRKIHQNPELGWKEENTRKLILNTLPKSFVVHETETTGIYADLIINPHLDFIAFRADMDALKMQEESGLPYASKNTGIAHACGHDFHTASLITLATVLDAIYQKGNLDLSYNIRLIFEPAEETPPGGAQKMIDAGTLKDVKVLFGFHLWSQSPTGMILLPQGESMINNAYSERLTVEVTGKGGHVAYPDRYNDPIVIARKIMDKLDELRESAKTSISDPILHSRLDDHGVVVNVIPEKVTVEATVRTRNGQIHDQLRKNIPQIIEETTKKFNATAKINFPAGYVPTKNNPDVVNGVKMLAQDLELPSDKLELMSAGESFGYYAKQVPSCFLMVGCGGSEDEVKNKGPHTAMHHNPAFNPDEGCFENILLLQLALALGWNL